MRLLGGLVAFGGAKTLSNTDLRDLLQSNYDWGDLPGLAAEQAADNNWMGDLPGMEYENYDKTDTMVDQVNEPMEYKEDDKPKEPFAPDLYYFQEDYPNDSPIEFDIAPNAHEKTLVDDSQSSSYGTNSYDEYYDYEYQGKGEEYSPGKGKLLKHTPQSTNNASEFSAGHRKDVDLQMVFVTRTEKEEKSAKVLTQSLPPKLFQPYDLIEWHYEPNANDKNLQLDTTLVIDGQRDSTSYLILLPGSPDGLYHFQLKYENVLLNATIFNVQTVAHEDTCDCLKARNLFETEPQNKQLKVVDADEGETESSMKNATKSEDMNLDNHQMAINIKNRLSNETHNFECIVSDHTIVSPHKFHEIQAGDKFVACYEVCSMSKPVVSAFWDIDFTLCSSRTSTAGSCLHKSQFVMDSCFRALNTNCFCPDNDQTQLTFITMRNNVGLSTMDYYYDTVGQYYLFNLCNKC